MKKNATCMKWMAAAALVVLAAGAAHATEGVVVGDTYVNSAHPATNYRAFSNLYVNSNGTALIQFDLSVLPARTTASQIGAASLKLYVNRVSTSKTRSPAYCDPNHLDLLVNLRGCCYRSLLFF